MSKAKNRRDKNQANLRPQPAVNDGRRKFLVIGLGGLGTVAIATVAGYKAGWFGSAPPAATPVPTTSLSKPTGKRLPPVTLTANYQNALRAADEIVSHYARELNNASTLIHAVRSFGKKFTLNDGSQAVDFLCTRFAAEKELNGKRYVYFPRSAEVHDNSFLKTMLEAGVDREQTIMAGGNKYTLRDLGESAKAIFRFDPENLQRYDPVMVGEHLPWGLIAFSTLMPPSQPTWVNAYGETIDLNQVIDRGFAAYETSSSGIDNILARGEAEPIKFREEMTKYSCDGMHMVYGLLSCFKNGYRGNNMEQRLKDLLETVIYRLEGDARATDLESEAAREYGQDYLRQMGQGTPPPQAIEVLRLRQHIRMIGHAYEAINFAKLHRLLTFTPDQNRRLQAGEQMLYDYLVRLRAIDLDTFMTWSSKFISDSVIAVAHAARGMKLLTPNNPDTIAVNRNFRNES